MPPRLRVSIVHALSLIAHELRAAEWCTNRRATVSLQAWRRSPRFRFLFVGAADQCRIRASNACRPIRPLGQRSGDPAADNLIILTHILRILDCVRLPALPAVI